MDDYYYLQHADSLEHFKTEARKAFASICLKYGFEEEDDVLIDDSRNLFQLTFSNQFLSIVVEGINWGMNAVVRLQQKEYRNKSYSIHQLLQARTPAEVITGNQDEQLYAYAHYLEKYADDILSGSKSFFIQQDIITKEEKERARQATRIEEEQKISMGYLKIETTSNEVIWRKPRPSLLSYTTALQQFPEATNIRMDALHDTLPYDQHNDVIIMNWKKELNDAVVKDEILCELTTDKVSVEIPAPVSGTLVWLLEEGNIIKSSDCLALLTLKL